MKSDSYIKSVLNFGNPCCNLIRKIRGGGLEKTIYQTIFMNTPHPLNLISQILSHVDIFLLFDITDALENAKTQVLADTGISIWILGVS